MVYNISMVIIRIEENEKNQRLDRFLRKYYRNAPLSYIYKLIRTAVKVNGVRVDEKTKLCQGDEISIDISKKEEKDFFSVKHIETARKQFGIAYEDKNILVVEKPFGLLTHGTRQKEKDTLTNQVIGYLIETGEYSPDNERIFSPSPVNRLDRNTTGLVIFGKSAEAVRSLSRMFREKISIRRYYLAIIHGEIQKPMLLFDRMYKDKSENIMKTKIATCEKPETIMETQIFPLKTVKGYSLVEAELLTGKTHQIRAQLAKAGYPILGDRKYGSVESRQIDARIPKAKAQLLHAWRIVFENCFPPLEYMVGKEIRCELPKDMKKIETALFKEHKN